MEGSFRKQCDRDAEELDELKEEIKRLKKEQGGGR